MSVRMRVSMVAVLLSCVTLSAATDIRLGTLVPANTSWHKALLDMGNTWKNDTGGRVTLTIYPGGTQGDEATTIKKMQNNVLQAAFLTSVGLAELDPAFNIFGMPFFTETSEEQAAIEKKLTPMLEQRLQPKGLHLLAWGTAGWVQLFSKQPLRTLADVKGAKLFASKGNDKWIAWYVANGFHPVPLLPADIPTQLKLSTGLINAAPNPPYLALSLQIFRDARYMLDLHIAPLTAVLVVTNTAWNSISPEDRAKVTAAAQAMEQRVRTEAPLQDAESIKQMQARGLQVITLDPKAADEFRAAAGTLSATIRGTMVPAEIYDAAVQARDAFRTSRGK